MVDKKIINIVEIVKLKEILRYISSGILFSFFLYPLKENNKKWRVTSLGESYFSLVSVQKMGTPFHSLFLFFHFSWHS